MAIMGFSILVATLVSSQQAAMLVVLLVLFLPSFFLTGLIVPVNVESLGSQLLAVVLPATHFVTISRSLFLKGAGLAELQVPALALAGMGLASIALSIAFFRKEVT
jgi:ABC-type multidrug transport system permease subunit